MAAGRAAAWLDRVEEGFMAVALGLMTALTFVQVILRYGFKSGMVWSLEATSFIFAWLIVVGMAYGVRTHSHIAVDLLTRTLPAGLQRSVATIAFALSLGYCALMAYASGSYIAGLIELGHFAQDIPLPRWLLTTILPAGFALLALRLVQAGRGYFGGDGATAAAGVPPDADGPR
jgi:C4-dicarboxylate transporter DctQ subunit